MSTVAAQMARRLHEELPARADMMACGAFIAANFPDATFSDLDDCMVILEAMERLEAVDRFVEGGAWLDRRRP